MFTTTAALLLSVAAQASNSTTSEVRDLLSLSQPGSYFVEYQTRYTELTAPERRAAQERYEVTKEACLTSGIADNGDIVTFRGSSEPACLLNEQVAGLVRTSERVDLAWPWFRVETTQGEGNAIPGATERRVHGKDGLTYWYFDGGRNSLVQRYSPDTPWDASAGAVMLFGRSFRQLGVLLDTATSEGLIETHKYGFHAWVPMQDAALMDRFDGFVLSNGVMVTPGHAKIEYRIHGERRMLSVTYSDCLDLPLVRQTMAWDDPESLPSRFEEQWWAPGSGVVFRHQTVTTARASGAAPTPDSLDWHGTPGQKVYDQRFGEEVVYELTEDGAPTDAEIALMTDRSRLIVTTGERSVGTGDLRVVDGHSHFTVTPTILPRTVPVGGVCRIELDLANLTEKTLSLNAPTVSCGVQDVGFEYNSILGLQSIPMTLDIQIREGGWNEVEVSLPYFGRTPEDCGALEIRFAILGEEIGMLSPRVVRSERWVEDEEIPLVAFGYGNSRSYSPVAESPLAGTNWSFEQEGDAHRVTLSSVDHRGLFGTIAVPIEVRSDVESRLGLNALALLDRVPAALANTWPETVLTLVGSFPRTRTFSIPGVAITAARIVENEGTGTDPLRMALEVDGDSVRLTERFGQQALEGFAVELDTSLGAIRLWVYCAPVQG